MACPHARIWFRIFCFIGCPLLQPDRSPFFLWPTNACPKPESGFCVAHAVGTGGRPLLWESERVLPQRGHSTTATELAVNRLRSMGITVRENVHLGEVLVCSCSFAVSIVFVVEACSFFGIVCRSGSFPCATSGSASSRFSTGTSGPAPSIIRSVS